MAKLIQKLTSLLKIHCNYDYDEQSEKKDEQNEGELDAIFEELDKSLLMCQYKELCYQM